MQYKYNNKSGHVNKSKVLTFEQKFNSLKIIITLEPQNKTNKQTNNQKTCQALFYKFDTDKYNSLLGR